MASIKIGQVTIPEFSQARRPGEEAELVILDPGRYEVFSHEPGGSYAKIPAMVVKTGERIDFRLGFGSDATSTHLICKILSDVLTVDFDPTVRLASFALTPGRVAYRLVYADTGIWIHER